MQKKSKNAKKSRKCTFDFKINAKKGINAKKISKREKKAHLFGFFRFYIPCAIFLHFKPKNSCKKKTKIKKKLNTNLQNTYAKKVENNISIFQRCKKKQKCKKKRRKKKQGGIYTI